MGTRCNDESVRPIENTYTEDLLETIMSDTSFTTEQLVAIANRILADENVLDAFGHVSARHPGESGRYLISRARSPELVEPGDVGVFTLESDPLEPNQPKSYAERVIHGEIYLQRPEVNAVCHFHAPALMPFCVTGTPLIPVTHVGATVGLHVPFWSSRDDFGNTDLIVGTREQGQSLAAALGSNWAVLMRNHGAVVVGRSIKEMVFRTTALCLNAEILQKALAVGTPDPLTNEEIELAGAFNLQPIALDRAWERWLHKLAKIGAMPH